MFLKKRKGSALLINAVLSLIVMMFVAQGLATVYSSQFSTLDASRTALQTLQFAEVKASELRVTAYNDIDSKAQVRTAIPSTNFEREVVVGAETDLGGGNKQKIATVNIYKPGETQPRFALPVPLSSQGSGGGVHVGTVIWYAAITPPTGWLVCNGQSTAAYPALAAVVGANVPDLRGEFIRGLDLGRGIDSGRIFASPQDWAIENITGSFLHNIPSGNGGNNGFTSTPLGVFYMTNTTAKYVGGSIGWNGTLAFDSK